MKTKFPATEIHSIAMESGFISAGSGEYQNIKTGEKFVVTDWSGAGRTITGTVPDELAEKLQIEGLNKIKTNENEEFEHVVQALNEVDGRCADLTGATLAYANLKSAAN